MKLRIPVIHWAVVLPMLVVALCFGAYLYGRWDAPDRSDALSSSLLDGIKAYAKRHNELTRQVNLLTAQKKVSDRKLLELGKKRTPTPAVVPAGCNAWAENLSTCDQQRGELENQVRAFGRIQALADQGRVEDSTRLDSAQTALKKQVGKDHILGIKLPSRRSSFAAGAVLTAVVCLLVSQPC